MNKHTIKGFLMGIVVMMVLIIGVTGLAALGNIPKGIDINAVLNSIDIYLNGAKMETNNIVYNGTTYVPLRTYAESEDLRILFDPVKGNNTIFLYDEAQTGEGSSLDLSGASGITTTEVLEEILDYSQKLEVKAYAYNESGTRKTKSGTYPNVGTIAVDPNVIPLGSLLYVEGYGFGVAEDTGGMIKGNTIDVYMLDESEVKQWGIKYVDVYVLNENQIKALPEGLLDGEDEEIEVYNEIEISKEYTALPSTTFLP